MIARGGGGRWVDTKKSETWVEGTMVKIASVGNEIQFLISRFMTLTQRCSKPVIACLWEVTRQNKGHPRADCGAPGNSPLPYLPNCFPQTHLDAAGSSRVLSHQDRGWKEWPHKLTVLPSLEHNKLEYLVGRESILLGSDKIACG
ncbi:hypothetical protein J6590_003765 [Homalodisca vitripennis]|nr:hypothetical protein J6590_003765 [Homalodisca vitripennis]